MRQTQTSVRLQKQQVWVLTALESALQTNNPGGRTKPKRSIYERRAYAAHRAAIAIDKYSRVARGMPAEKDRILLWMKRWIAFVVGKQLRQDGHDVIR